MTLQAVTLHLPEPVYQRAKHAADVLKRPVEDLIVDTLTSTLPVLDDVPAEMASEIAAMAHLSDEALQGLATSTLRPERQTLLSELLDKQGRGELAEAEQRELAALMAEYGRSMLRRAKAVALLVARGKPLPALTPLPPAS
jgi:hypothetical protein